MPTVTTKDGEKKYVSKKQLKKIRKEQNGPAWNPKANGKLVRMDDGAIMEITPAGWIRRHDVEARERVEKLAKEKGVTNESDTAKQPDRISVSAGAATYQDPSER